MCALVLTTECVSVAHASTVLTLREVVSVASSRERIRERSFGLFVCTCLSVWACLRRCSRRQGGQFAPFQTLAVTARLWLHFFVCGRACVHAKRVLACRSKGLHSARHFRSVVAHAWPSARTSFTSLYLPPSPPALSARPVVAGLCVSVPSVLYHYHPYQRLCRACTSWTLPAPLSRSQRNCQRPAQCGRTHAHMERT